MDEKRRSARRQRARSARQNASVDDMPKPRQREPVQLGPAQTFCDSAPENGHARGFVRTGMRGHLGLRFAR